ncbi:hypothetical protein L3X38_042267 [Prunus dulcis]|uniref:26S proteasome non-ATPase regulatory subunit 4 homolog n=1 Tax=Prunus dulcis TaxID=3755 RepID=A0AAD4UVL1_PRUDU|nr:hypothetical protein L3X38_042267 [Prunus dulcis]
MQCNPENTVGVLTMAGKGVRVLVTPTGDLGKILACMHGLEIGGEMNLAAGIQVAQLALKHRQNKKQQQRIIVFAGSTVKHDKKFLEIIGRRLKKNSVVLDIFNFGEEDEEKSKRIEALFKTLNNNDTSHIVHVPPGPSALSDVLISTPIFTGDGEGGSGFAAAAAAAAAGGVSGFDFGVDPNLDPELDLALRPIIRVMISWMMRMLCYNRPLQYMSEATGEDPELALALQLSVQESAKDSGSQKDTSKLLADQSFVSSILASLPGVDPNDPSVKDLLASLNPEIKLKIYLTHLMEQKIREGLCMMGLEDGIFHLSWFIAYDLQFAISFAIITVCTLWTAVFIHLFFGLSAIMPSVGCIN